jgi:hydrogenase nickel incorporation protein HypA/HybF
VSEVTIRVGRLRQVVPDSLEFNWGLVRRDTVCDAARLDQILVPARLRCAACSHEWEIDLPIFHCPQCSGTDVSVLSGEEFEVESIVVEEEPACTA